MAAARARKAASVALTARGEAYCLRARLEAAVETAIAALDAFDGDADLEDVCEDEGAQCEGEGDYDEREPTLGWSSYGNQGLRFGTGGPLDLTGSLWEFGAGTFDSD